jgi:DNA-binding MarR family transcriptional regulator
MSQELRNELFGIDRLIHEPARLIIMTILYAIDEADFLYLVNETGLTRGNLSTHLSKLEAAGYIKIEKTFRGKIPRTVCTLSEAGRAAFEKYRKQLRQIAGRI